ncbi:ribonuclease H, partial [Trifolium pratense]
MLIHDKLEGGIEWRVVWAVTCYHLWLWRNKETFDPEFVRPRHAAHYILQVCITSAFNAELWGVHEGICLAKQNGFNNIELQIDSMIVVRNLGGDRLGSSGGRCLVRRIRSLFQEGWNVRIRHVYRETNRVADALAALGCQQDAFTLFDAPPLGVDQLCSFDSSGVS